MMKLGNQWEIKLEASVGVGGCQTFNIWLEILVLRSFIFGKNALGG